MESMPLRHCTTCTCTSWSFHPPDLDTQGQRPPPARTSTTSLSDIASLDARIDDLHHQLAEARRQRNALVPITSRLPDEILAEIFERARATCDYGWLAFSHVSQRWRAVALADARLWTAVNVGRPRLAAELLGRTGGAALSLYSRADARRVPAPDKLSALLPVIERVLAANAGQRVDSIRIDTSVVPLVNQHVIPYASHLKTLVLDTGKSGRTNSVPDSIQALGYPSLRKLRLRGWSADWTSSMFTSAARLRTMELIRTSRSDTTVTSKEMCIALRSMASLEVLVMIASIPRRIVGEGIAPVSMPRLRRIRLEGTSQACRSLLELLDKPEVCQTELSTYGGRDEEDVRADGLISYLGIPTPERVSIRLAEFGRAVIVAAYTILHPHSPHHQLQIPIPTPVSADFMRSIRNLLADLPHSTLLDVDPADFSRHWYDSLYEAASASVVEMDWEKCGRHKNQWTLASTVARYATMFPNMRTLVLKHIDFEKISREVVHAITSS